MLRIFRCAPQRCRDAISNQPQTTQDFVRKNFFSPWQGVKNLKYDQTYPYTFANLGYALLQKEQFEEAVKMIDKALQLDPKCGEAHLSYANYYAYKKDWKKSEVSANKAIECGQMLNPEFRRLLEKNGAKLKAASGPAKGSQPVRC